MRKLLSIIILFFAFNITINAQSKTIIGKVVDENGSPLPGVSVVVKGTTIGTVTNVDGEYKLEVPINYNALIFSFIGYKTQEVKIGNKSVLDAKLASDNEVLEEVVVTALGISRPRLFRKRKNKKLKRSNPYTGYSLHGNVSGINITENNTEEYDQISETKFSSPLSEPLSTFSIDVDGASYSNARRMLNNGNLPVKDAVRIEEFINYFNYKYDNPQNEQPFSVFTEVGNVPWNPKHKLVHIGIQGKKLKKEEIKPSNLVFLIDVSGSMNSSNKLHLLKKSFKMLLNELDDRDRVAIVVYAGAAGVVLPSTRADKKDKILEAINKLSAGGSTAGGEGIQLAYKIAEKNLIKNGNNRIILATDGDFNVGISSNDKLVKKIETMRDKDIFLTICGFGMGNYKDGKMEQISNAGNGNYFYIDNIKEAQKVFVSEMRSTLFTIAKDVKIQVEFNPALVKAYRLIGYENRILEDEDFNDDTKDAGELGPGHTVTALYEIIPVGVKSSFSKKIDDLKYQKPAITSETDELMTVKLRYKKPKGIKSQLISTTIKNENKEWKNTSENFRFSAAVASFGLLLRDSEFKGKSNFDQVISLAKNAKGSDEEGHRAEFIQLVKLAKNLSKTGDSK